MGPGSIIEIPTNNNTGSRYFTDSKFEACDTMWRGIVVHANNNLGSGISLTRTTIEDAWRGVELENNTTLISKYSNFYDNYVGVFVGGNNLKTIHTEISDSQFENKGDMLPAYAGQADWSSRAAFGVHATGMTRMNIFSSGSPNKFINLGTGVWVNNVNLVASNNMFEDTDIFPSVGIYVGTIPSQVEIINGNSFIDLEKSIHIVGNINRSSAIILNNTFLNERTNNVQDLRGIYVQRCPITALTISGINEFDYIKGTCISIRGGLNSLKINNNKFNISGPNLGPIFVDNIQFKSEINENEFIVNENVAYTNICIRLQNSQKVNLFENELNGTSTSTGASLLSLHGSNKCLVKGNVINYNHAVGFNIWATGSNENGFCCNKAINPAGTSSRSFGFYGENGVSPFRQNDLNSLYLNGNFGTQTSAGNNWLGTGNFARLVDANQTSAEKNQFKIDQNVAGGLPSSIIPSIISVDWFDINGTHPTCSNVPDCNITNFTNDTLDPDLTDDGPDPQDTIIVIVDPARPSCEALKDLYERLESIDSTTSPLAYWSVVSLIHKWKVWKGAAWIQSCLDSVVTFNPDITPWYDAEKEKEKLNKVEEDLRQDMAGVMQEIIELNENLDTIQVDSNLTMPPYVVQWYEQLKDAIDSLNTLNNELQADIQTNANSMLTLVNNLPTPFGFLADRKKVWFVEMRYIIGGLNVISQSQWDEIRVIADKCPLTDGQAVYEAMSLLRLLDEEVEIHEDCAPSVPRTVLKSTPELVKVYPNPGKGLFTFEIPKTLEADQCLILDVNGRTIKQLSVQKNVESFQVDLSSVKPGLYLYVFKNDGIFVQQGKIIVIE